MLYIASLTFSPALLSISMFGLAAAALFSFSAEKLVYLDIKAIKTLLTWWRYPVPGVITLLFFIVLLSGLQGGDLSYWLERLRIKLPLLVMPLMFIMFPRFSQRDRDALLYFLLIWLSINCIGIGINYWLSAEAIHELMRQGKPIPTPGNHIRFSVLMAYGIISGCYLCVRRYYYRYPAERKVIFSMTIFLFLFLHLLSVRSGLAVLYITLSVMSLYLALRTRRYWIGISAIVLLVSMPLIGYYQIPSFRAKVDYMLYDRWMYERGEGGQYADSGRIASLEIGYSIFQDYPLVGVGTGHMRDEVHRRFELQYPDRPHALMPHNQFLYSLASHGIIGLVVFLVAFFYPLFRGRRYRDPLLLAFYLVFISINTLEHHLENSVGIASFVFFLCVLVRSIPPDQAASASIASSSRIP